MTSNKALIERLREMPVLLDKAPVMYARAAYDQCLKAADALEAQAKEISELREALKPFGLDDAGIALEKWRGAPDDRFVAMHTKLGDLRRVRAKLKGS